jgi:hypothetical protein
MVTDSLLRIHELVELTQQHAAKQPASGTRALDPLPCRVVKRWRASRRRGRSGRRAPRFWSDRWGHFMVPEGAFLSRWHAVPPPIAANPLQTVCQPLVRLTVYAHAATPNSGARSLTMPMSSASLVRSVSGSSSKGRRLGCVLAFSSLLGP